MLQNYLLMTLRHIRRHKGFTLLNIAGLAIGLSSCILILLYVQDELTYDRFHAGADRIIKVQTRLTHGEQALVADPPAAFAEAAVETSPEILQSVRIHRAMDRSVVSQGDVRHYEETVTYAEPAFLQVFNFPLREGAAATALNRPNTVVITEEAADRYFGDADPVGRTLTLDSERDLEVTGVLRSLPSNTVFRFDFLVSFETLRAAGDELSGWSGGGYETYLVVAEGYDPATLETEIGTLMETNAPKPSFIGTAARYEYMLTPVTELHLASIGRAGLPALGGTLRYVYLFSAIAGLILVIACLNFTNLSTARASQRAREIGMRKVIGATRTQLLRQFLGEAFAYSAIAIVTALLLSEAALPWFNVLVEKRLALVYFGSGSILPALFALFLIVGLLAGAYPAFLLSSFRPAGILKGRQPVAAGGARLRKGLVVFQFAVSAMLITGVIVVHGQLRYMQEQHLALNPDQVVMMPAQEGITSGFESFKSELGRLPGVTNVTISNFPEGIGLPIMPEGSERGYIGTLIVDADFLETMGIRLVEGRDFIPGSADAADAVILNEAAVAEFGWTEGLGRSIERVNTNFDPVTSEVIGITEDFYSGSLKRAVGPMMIMVTDAPDQSLGVPSVLMRIRPADLRRTLDDVERIYARFAPSYPFEYQFLDDRFASFYRAEQRLAWIVAGFSVLAVLIGCLGLFGLAAFASEQRTREIGIRKVLGATVASIVSLLSREFLILVGIAFLVGAPLAYLALQKWLEDFAHRIHLGPLVFIQAGILLLIVGILPVAFQSLKAAMSDPVKSLNPES